ncbi:hypothetical protein MJO29_013113 [Puccinia striiformis f. sp. tritici]|uniref:Uncharacterized protein n=2 Tax=Puccinia striiformis TaxID=27350 RepID=A0A0L0USP2_9BASI|nr:hypothetical protein MJO29_013113 [Puccinia striiformis f. sp. tritici]KNE90000.1 hypothetical protein PSTG_16551 [Puccinia striiformis f. sp. tritici PST-78]POW17104.1 hypothetical protein PSTT_00800 [Puccinia striiformis]
MVMSMSALIQGDVSDLASQFEGVRDSLAPLPSTNKNPKTPLQEVDPMTFFGNPSTNDVSMKDSSATSSPDPETDQICTDLQAKFKLDPTHLDIVVAASHCAPEARHASLVFVMAAFYQLDFIVAAPPTNHLYDNRFKDFVRCHACMILLNPTLQAYSDNPHQNGALPRTLSYLTLDAVEQQPIEWKEDHLAPGQLRDDPVALESYREVIGELLKHQRSNLQTLLSANILSTQRINIKGAVPNRHEMLTSIYQDLPPKGDKMTAAEIRAQVDNNWAMRIRMTYARLVMVHYYVHKSKKTSQWLEIDERLGILRAASIEFQKHHAQLVLDKDNELFSHLKKFSDIPKDDFTVPSLEDVRASMACDEMADN